VRDAIESLWRHPLTRVVVALVLLAGAAWFVIATRGVWFIVVTAFVLAYLLHPLVRWSRRRFHVRWIGLVVSVLAVLGVLALFALLFFDLFEQLSGLPQELPRLVQQATSVTQHVPALIQDAPLPSSLKVPLGHAYGSLQTQVSQWARQLLDQFATYVTGGGLFHTLRALVGDVVRLLGLLALTAYLLADFQRVTRSLRLAAPEPYQATVGDVIDKFEHAVGGYFRGQLIVAGIVGAVTGLGLAVLGVPLALSLGFLGGLFDLVPYLGPVIAITPALLLAAPLGWWTVIGVLIVYTFANQLEGHVLEPLVLGRTVRLHPTTVVIALLLGLHFGGVLGALLAVPLMGFAKLLVDEYYRKSRFYREG
jgi:predicted PurR-regulated permease PerM